MLTLETVSRMESLLSRLPATREFAVQAYADALREHAVPDETWDGLMAFLHETERPVDDLVVFEDAKRATEEGRSLSSEALSDMLEVLEGAALDLREALLHAAPHDEDLDPEFLALRDSFLHRSEVGEEEGRESSLAIIQDFIYENPGHFLREIFRRLKALGAIRVSYQTMCHYVEELADRGEILTIGKHQGVPRYCFPHPDKVTRANYFGRSFPVFGDVEDDISDRFSLSGTFAKVYLVNHMMRKVAMVAPLAVRLERDEEIEGFGRIQGPDYLTERLHMESEEGLPGDVDGVVHIERLRRREGEGEGEDIDIPESFRRLGAPQITH